MEISAYDYVGDEIALIHQDDILYITQQVDGAKTRTVYSFALMYTDKNWVKMRDAISFRFNNNPLIATLESIHISDGYLIMKSYIPDEQVLNFK